MTDPSTSLPDWPTLGRAVLARQPFSTLIGVELAHLEAGKAELRLPIRDDLLQQHGFVHGGVVAYLADNALTFAGGAALGGDVVTAELKINYLRPARGDLLIARASTVGAGRTQAVTRCEIYAVAAGDERLCAAAQGTIQRIGDR